MGDQLNTSSFFKVPPELWRKARETIPAPWSQELIEIDRLWLCNEERCNRPFPTQRALAALWGWSRNKVETTLFSKKKAKKKPKKSQSTPDETAFSSTKKPRKSQEKATSVLLAGSMPTILGEEIEEVEEIDHDPIRDPDLESRSRIGRSDPEVATAKSAASFSNEKTIELATTEIELFPPSMPKGVSIQDKSAIQEGNSSSSALASPPSSAAPPLHRDGDGYWRPLIESWRARTGQALATPGQGSLRWMSTLLASPSDLALLIDWAYLAPDSSWMRGANKKGAKYLSLRAILKEEYLSERLELARAWDQQGRPTTIDSRTGVDVSVEAEKAWVYVLSFAPKGRLPEPHHPEPAKARAIATAVGAIGWRRLLSSQQTELAGIKTRFVEAYIKERTR